MTNVAYPHSCRVRAHAASTAPFPLQPCAITIAGNGPLPDGKPSSPESTTGSPRTRRDRSGELGRVPALANQIVPESADLREGLRSFRAGAQATATTVTRARATSDHARRTGLKVSRRGTIGPHGSAEDSQRGRDRWRRRGLQHRLQPGAARPARCRRRRARVGRFGDDEQGGRRHSRSVPDRDRDSLLPRGDPGVRALRGRIRRRPRIQEDRLPLPRLGSEAARGLPEANRPPASAGLRRARHRAGRRAKAGARAPGRRSDRRRVGPGRRARRASRGYRGLRPARARGGSGDPRGQPGRVDRARGRARARRDDLGRRDRVTPGHQRGRALSSASRAAGRRRDSRATTAPAHLLHRALPGDSRAGAAHDGRHQRLLFQEGDGAGAAEPGRCRGHRRGLRRADGLGQGGRRGPESHSACADTRRRSHCRRLGRSQTSHARRPRDHRLGAGGRGILRGRRIRRSRLPALACHRPLRGRVAARWKAFTGSVAVRSGSVRAASAMKIAGVRVILADIPVRRPHKMSFTTLEAVNFAFVRIETADGLVGWGEAACLGGPTWSEESSESVAITIERYIAPWLTGRDATQIEALSREMAKRVQGNPFARAAVEMALWDLNGKALGVPVHRLLGGRVRDSVPLSWSLAVESPDAEVAEARAKVALGHRIFKIKTAAHPVDHDVERVRRLREAVGPDVSLRVDANQGWDRPTALRAIRALEPYRLDFVEQPVPRWDGAGLAEIARAVTVPVMADEACCSTHDALAIARLGGVSILALKLTKSAGILGTMAIARIAEAAGMSCYVGCMIETSLGTAAYLQVALAAAPVTWGCELFGPLLLTGDVVRHPVQYADGAILALDGPGLGVEVDESRLKEWTRQG